MTESGTHWTIGVSERTQREIQVRVHKGREENRTRARLAQGEPLIFLFFLSSLLAYDGFFSLKKGDTGLKGRERGDYTKHSRTTGVSAATAQLNVRPSNE